MKKNEEKEIKQLEKEEDYFIIASEILKIVGTGLSEEDAKVSFAEEFEYVYNKLNSLNDNKLTERNKLIKANINKFVKSIDK